MKRISEGCQKTLTSEGTILNTGIDFRSLNLRHLILQRQTSKVSVLPGSSFQTPLFKLRKSAPCFEVPAETLCV